MQIESLQNPKIKTLLKLQEKSRERKKQGLFVVEGIQENQLALEGGFEPVEFFICPDIFTNSFEIKTSIQNEVSKSLFEKRATVTVCVKIICSTNSSLAE